MTLKNHLTGLSEKAKAFSVERLIEPGSDERVKTGPIPGNDITIELCSRELWETFSEIGTEMIVTKAGRRMFPTLKVRFHGLSMSKTYIAYMDIIPVDESRYRYIYHSSQWMAAGASEVYSEHNTYIHPDSPATGQVWVSQGHISFDKIKLTNNKKPVMTGQISLNSMHKYLPRIHILEVPMSDNLRLNTVNDMIEYVRAHKNRATTFSFKETEFITVTAYQNQEITKLKIQSNPFAKGFRETTKQRNSKPLPPQPCLPSDDCHRGEFLPPPQWAALHKKAQTIPLKLVIPPVEMRESEHWKSRDNTVNIFYKTYR